MTDPQRLVSMLSPTERALIEHLETGLTISQLAEKSGLQEVEVMRACQFLGNKDIISLTSEDYVVYTLTQRGKDVLENGFPEERFLKALDTEKTLDEIRNDAGLEQEEVNISIGMLRREKAIEMGSKVKKIQDVDFSKKHEQLRSAQTAKTVDRELVKRGLVEESTKTTHSITLEPNYDLLKNADLSKKYEERLTHDMLKTGAWKNKEFRRYDVTTPVPKTTYGRSHFVQEAIAHIKQIWVEMGFEEMKGTHVQTAFWDLDALFVPQDHPAREEQDTFYLPDAGTLPEWYKDVAQVHEDGGNTSSTGWQTPYSAEEASKVLLRTHTTVLSAQYLKNLDLNTLPRKFFSVAKVFRNETLDWKHLAEFHQVEGIVVGEGLTIADLIGLQEKFYKRMGFEKVRFRPAYFPYTEPSAEVEVFHAKKKQWIELGGMGVLRPETVVPLLGKDVPVLAWGLGMERIITDYYDITDLRDIYGNDVDRLRSAPAYQEDTDANN